MKEIENRRSIRSYSAKAVEEEKIKELIESARLAPSGSNTQPWRFILVKSQEVKDKIVAADHNQTWMAQAPLLIVCLGDIRCRIKEDTEISLQEDSPQEELKQVIRDTAIAVEHMVLTAENLGLSTCWTAWFHQDDMRAALNIPSDKYVVCVLTVGYTDKTEAPRPRMSAEEIVRFEKWE